MEILDAFAEWRGVRRYVGKHKEDTDNQAQVIQGFLQAEVIIYVSYMYVRVADVTWLASRPIRMKMRNNIGQKELYIVLLLFSC